MTQINLTSLIMEGCESNFWSGIAETVKKSKTQNATKSRSLSEAFSPLDMLRSQLLAWKKDLWMCFVRFDHKIQGSGKSER